MGDIIIVAPHCDDECIGTWEILSTKNPVIIYDGDTPSSRREEAMKLRDHIKVKAQLFQKSIPPTFINKETTLIMPDPIYEIHPLHRYWGNIGEKLARTGINVVFYNTNMNAPYIHEVKNIKEKEALLNAVYPSQSDMWKYEKKYILFEGYNQWIF